MWPTLILVLLVAVPLALLAAGQFGLLAGRPPADLGLRQGRLKPPSPTANSVSSEAALHAGHRQAGAAQIDPLPLLRGDAEGSLARLGAVLAAHPGARVVEAAPGYLRAEARTRWLGFVDDLEFHADRAAGVIQLRSASRLGSLDFGANRSRIEAIRAAYLAGQ